MARRSRMSVLKRQRELRQAEKAARKRAKRHGIQEQGFTEPQPTVLVSELSNPPDSPDGPDETETVDGENATPLTDEPS